MKCGSTCSRHACSFVRRKNAAGQSPTHYERRRIASECKETRQTPTATNHDQQQASPAVLYFLCSQSVSPPLCDTPISFSVCVLSTTLSLWSLGRQLFLLATVEKKITSQLVESAIAFLLLAKGNRRQTIPATQVVPNRREFLFLPLPLLYCTTTRSRHAHAHTNQKKNVRRPLWLW
jgi:hypothetical protein